MSNEKKDFIPVTPVDAAAPRRPHATLDLKATEIKAASTAGKDTAGVQEARDVLRAATGDTPRPATPSAYTTASRDRAPDAAPDTKFQRGATKQEQKPWWTASASPIPSGSKVQAAVKPQITSISSSYSGEVKMSSSQTSDVKSTASADPKPETTSSNAEAAAPAKVQTPASPPRTEKIVVQKRGGFVSHTFAGILGGALALGATQWAAPRLGLPVILPSQSLDISPFEKRLQALEKGSSDLTLSNRIADLERTAQTIPALAERQTRFIAETKATLAASESSAGSTQQFERLDKLESQMKEFAAAGTGSSSAASGEQQMQIAAKVAEIETNFARQLETFKGTVGQDIETRLAALQQSSEASKAGSEQAGKDIASVKSEAAKVAGQYEALKADYAKLADRLKTAEVETVGLKAAIDSTKSASAKTEDIATAVAPLTEKVAALDKNVATVLTAEAGRRANAERVLLSLELQNLKRALDRGQSFGAELESVQKAGGAKIDLTALAKFKDQGVPAVIDLSRDFPSVANAALRAGDQQPNGGVVDRLLSGAKSVIRVRTVDHAPDDKSAEAVVGRMETALKNAKLGDVLSEAKDLPLKAQDAVRPFLDRVAARESVESALTDLETQIKTALSEPAAPKAEKTP